MIDRYASPIMREIWSEEEKYRTWLLVEMTALRAMEKAHIVPEGTARSVEASVDGLLSPARIAQLESSVKHDLVAFLHHLEELCGPSGRWVHYGLTSSDVVDAALALRMLRAGEVILVRSDRLVRALAHRAEQHATDPMIGRTHGMWAEPTTFGLALASHMLEIHRCRARVRQAVDEVRAAKLSGAVGTRAFVPADVASDALRSIGLVPDVASTQVVARDRHASYLLSMALMASALERLAVNLRHWQRSEVGEAFEPFSSGQRGSSAMPHKRNPVTSEKVCGLSRVVRSLASSALENVPLWHERDISHSSSERVVVPQVTSYLEHMLTELVRVVDGLDVRAENMDLRAASASVNTEGAMLALVRDGMSRKDAHAVVQSAVEAGGEEDLAVRIHRAARRLTVEEIRLSLLDLGLQARCASEVLNAIAETAPA